MNFFKTEISDLIICQPKIIEDSRGYFFESFKAEELNNFLGKKIKFIQDNESFSRKGTLRGLHFQKSPYEQTKLVKVVKGEILDVAVDIRKNSKTYGNHFKIILNDKNKKQLFIPKGFAHGLLVLSGEAIVSYKVDQKYSLDHDSGIIFNDKNLKIDWGYDLNKINLSEKDKNLSLFGNN